MWGGEEWSEESIDGDEVEEATVVGDEDVGE